MGNENLYRFLIGAIDSSSRPTLKLKWKSETPVWVDQWPLPQEKLQHIQELVQEQLDLGHIRPSVSPWNTPIFTIQKKSGKWRLLHDLRAINEKMVDMGALQPGLPSPTMLPQNWDLLIIDLKDCFFTIPLHEDDCEKFAFTVPAINRAAPAKRYEWVVLPQGMKNSPTICQWFVDLALQSWRENNPNLITYHYMDDLLIASPHTLAPEKEQELIQSLQTFGLVIAKEKVQKLAPWNYLGLRISETRIQPQKIISVPNIKNVNDVQKLVGDIQWLRTFCGITNMDLAPLLALLKGGSSPADPRSLSPEAEKALEKITQKIQNVGVDRRLLNCPFTLLVYNRDTEIVAIIAQLPVDRSMILLEWVFHSNTLKATVTTRADAVGQLLLKARERLRTLAGCDPEKIILPVKNLSLADWWIQISESFAVATLGIQLDNHYPNHPLFKTSLVLEEKSLQQQNPIKNALTVFTDASSKTQKCGYAYRDDRNNWISHIEQMEGSVQILELKAVLMVFQEFRNVPLNVVSDSKYVVGIVSRLSRSLLGSFTNDRLMALVIQMWNEINFRQFPWWITHIRSHLDLPGVLSEGIDTQVASPVLQNSPLKQATESHAFFHQSARSLQKQFGLSRQDARTVIAACPDCARLTPLQQEGTNPRGLQPRQIWQTDVTEFTPFGVLKYVHVTIDTCSKAIWATAHKSTNAVACIQHWTSAMAVLGRPDMVKTDNAPAYLSARIKTFLLQWQVKHVTGIPNNSGGQAIIERAHQSLKHYLSVFRKEGERSPHVIVAKACYVLNWLNPRTECTEQPIFYHFSNNPNDFSNRDIAVQVFDPVSNCWSGPHNLLTWGRGYACISTGAVTKWIPAKWVRPWIENRPTEKKKQGDYDRIDS